MKEMWVDIALSLVFQFESKIKVPCILLNAIFTLISTKECDAHYFSNVI